jgi:hypothetical protein
MAEKIGWNGRNGVVGAGGGFGPVRKINISN